MKTIIEQFKTMVGMKFFPGVSAQEIEAWERENGVTLPSAYKEWLRFSDGGEIFIPGMQFYGITHKPLLSFCNKPDERGDLPGELIVIGGFGFGDILCFVRDEDTILQWDHENGEEFMRWENFRAFLSEAEKLFE